MPRREWRKLCVYSPYTLPATLVLELYDEDERLHTTCIRTPNPADVYYDAKGRAILAIERGRRGAPCGIPSDT